jgi:tetratricopeptide (TPR) repeat protein
MMKTHRLFLLLFLIVSFSGLLRAQQTIYYQSVQSELQKARELYHAGDYVSALKQFDQLAGKADDNSEVKVEAVFYSALCGLKLDNRNAEEQVKNFLKVYPESSFRNRASFELALYEFDKQKYKSVLKTLDEVNLSGLDHNQLEHYYYLHGYSNFQINKLDTAANDFARIKEGNSPYAAPAKYYWAHIQYVKANYEAALQEFNKLKDNPAFSKVIPFYISQIYYRQKKYQEVFEYTAPMINRVSADQQPELARILGNSLFHLGQFKDAIQFLEFYLSDKANKGREENYELGYCYYLNSEEARAIPYLEMATKGKDEIAQNAYYHLADCYITTGDKNKARQAFEAASEFDFDPKIKEDALFNYAKITYELSYSPFNETIKAFDKYISLYPNSQRNDAAYDYLVKVYMSTSNYKDAMASIEKIKVKSPAVKKAYQRVAYYRGLECFNDLDYQAAIDNFDKSMNAGDFNKNYGALSAFWKAEAYYRMNDYNGAINGYSRFVQLPGSFALPEYKTAYYNLGYAYFQLKDYDNAAAQFRKYLNLQNDFRSDKVADANNRLGDCMFMGRNYAAAIPFYEKAYKLNTYDADYALFQKAFCQGLQRDNQGKINTLQELVRNFPNSSYQDDALYELGRTFERINQPQQAIDQYKDLLAKFPQSAYVTKAQLQLGLIDYNANNYQESNNYYKQVVEHSPNGPEAQAALAGIKNNYVEMNDVDAYFKYTSKLGPGVQVSQTGQDSLTFRAAERLYMARDPKARTQLEHYVNQFPNGLFALNARFYLAELLYAAGENDKALAAYQFVISQPDNAFTEEALAKGAGLEFDSGNYQQALAWFRKYAALSSSANDLLGARVGIMRCLFRLENYSECIDAATQVLNTDKVSVILKREANYKLAISYYKTGASEKAFPILKELSADTNSAEGAEAKYLVAQILFDQQKVKESEKEIMDFISKNSPHQYWLAKSFILLSDIYLKNGDEFQAKHTLKSIQDNYANPTDGIQEAARQKLQQIEAAESSQSVNQNKPLEIDLGGNKK